MVVLLMSGSCILMNAMIDKFNKNGHRVCLLYVLFYAAQIVIVNSVVLLSGLLHILNRWTVISVFYGIFIVRERLEDVVSVLYRKGYAYLYGEERAGWIVGLTGAAAGLWLVGRGIRLLRYIRTRRCKRLVYIGGGRTERDTVL